MHIASSYLFRRAFALKIFEDSSRRKLPVPEGEGRMILRNFHNCLPVDIPVSSLVNLNFALESFCQVLLKCYIKENDMDGAVWGSEIFFYVALLIVHRQ